MSLQGAGQAAAMAGDQAKAEKSKRAIFALLDTVSSIDPFASGYHAATPGSVAVNVTAVVPSADAGVKKPPPRARARLDSAPVGIGAGDLSAQVYSVPATLPSEITGAITLSHVSFAYPTRPDTMVLNDVSLDIRPGQVVALVGSSGCGKSSIVALLERWYDVSQGSVSVDGMDVKTVHPCWLRDSMALVQQEPVLFGDSVAYNIAYGMQVRLLFAGLLHA